MAITDRPGRVRPARGAVRDFVAWVASAPYSMVDEVRAAIAEDCDEAVVDEIGEMVLSSAETDVAHLSTALAILGESGHPAAIRYLRDFVWSTDDIDELVADAHMPPLTDGKLIACELGLPGKQMLRTRATEMLCYLKIEPVFEYTLQIITEHPEPQVRHAAIDAYLYNNDDSDEARERVLRVVRDDDLPWVGLPRRTADMDAAAFDGKLAALHAEDPPPPVPAKRDSAKG
ncbi:hypothetical protein [Nocardia cyriacigeorgica]|uniref:hypothetical protein n=1 Tax=Nocardia cyriacigeorgica TaxID=135487 RepID=UPI001E29E348|nr:hypothetical protein [Nocardia cyriacigeorgica]MBF6413555.1 hypothetical protein [Nocardia cyriacigeorgica]